MQRTLDTNFSQRVFVSEDSVARRTWSGQDYGCYWERGERIKGSHICWKVVSRKGQGLALTVIVTADRPPWGKTPPHSRHNRNGLLRCIQTSTLRQTFYSSNSSWTQFKWYFMILYGWRWCHHAMIWEGLMPNRQPTHAPRLLSFQNDQQQNQIEQNFEEKMPPNVFKALKV